MLSVNFSPFPMLSTVRLHLRNINADDAAGLFYLRSNPEVLKFLDRAPMTSVTEASNFINTLIEQQNKNEGIIWAVTFKDDPEKMIGTISYWKIIKEHYRAEIGYLLMPDQWGKGIMKEALETVVQYGFNQMNLHSIEANIHPANTASAALLESCKFKKEGYFRESYYYAGNFSDTAIYSRIKE